MDVVSHCALSVAGRVWKPRPGAFVLTFVCKATFALAPGKLVLAPEQQPVHEADCPWSATVTSLYAAGDMVPRKPRADVVLIGNAYAPGGVPVRMLVARLAVAEVDKAIEVWCDRTLRPDGSVIHGPSFTDLPLLYERAAGGPGTDNPVGLSPERDAYGAVALPNLTPPGTRAGLDVTIPPTCFGPIAARWPSRRAFLDRLAEPWAPERWHDKPLPNDLDLAYFNVAPVDQRFAALRGDERITLENLHPEHAVLTMTLPDLRPRATVTGRTADKQPIALGCDTLWIDTSRRICCVTYRGHVVLSSPTEAGWVVVTLDDQAPVILEKPRPDKTKPDDSSGVRKAPAGGVDLTGTLAIEEPAARPRAPAPTLPFMATPEPPPPDTERERVGGGLPFQSAGEIPRPAAPPPVVPKAPPVFTPPAAVAPAVPAFVPPPPVVAPKSDSPWAAPGGGPGAGTIAPVVAAASAAATPEYRGGGSALAASNAAVSSAESVSRAPEIARAAPVVAPAARAAPKEAAEAMDLVFFDAESLPRVRRVPAWKKLLAALDDRPLDLEEDDPAAAKDPMGVEDKREIVEILVRATPSDAAALDDALGRAVREDGRFLAPLVLLAGELATPFDEVETLKAAVTTAAPLVGNDESLRASVEIAKDFLALPGLSSSPAVAEGLTTRVREAWNQGKRVVPQGYLDAQTERALLEQRAYQRRQVLGGRRVRALFHLPQPAQGAAPLVVYLPDDVASKLPMFSRWKARLIARVHLPVDQYEQGAMCLEALALSRLVAAPKRPS